MPICTRLILTEFTKPLAIADEEVAGQRVEERRREERIRDLGFVLRIAAPNVLTELIGDVHIGQMELCHLTIDECTSADAKVFQRKRLLVLSQTELLVDGVHSIAVLCLQLLVGDGEEVEYGKGSDKLNKVSVVALTVATRVVEVGIRGHLIAQIVAGVNLRQRQVDAILAQAGEVVVIIEQGRLGLRDEVATRDRAVVVLLHVSECSSR